MSQIIEQHFDEVEVCLLQSPAVVAYQILRREIAYGDAKLRVKLELFDGGMAELFEYISEVDNSVHLLKYSFHWQDAKGKLKKRWDNAPHHPDLPNAPHHVHHEDSTVQHIKKPLDIFGVIKKIEEELTQT